MTKPTCQQLSELDGVKQVSRQVDDSWRHGCRITEVFKREADGTFWQAQYRLSADGETNEMAEGLARIVEVEPYEKTITDYRPVPEIAAQAQDRPAEGRRG